MRQLGGLRQAATDIAGTLRVTASASFGRQYLSPLLPEFLTRTLRVRLSIDLTDQMLDLVSAGFDLAIRIGALDDSSLVARKLAVNRRVVCASPDYVRRHGMPTLQDLTGHECVLLMGSAGRQDVWRFGDGAGGEIAVRVRGRVETNYGELVRDAAVAGMGIAVHSRLHVCQDLREWGGWCKVRRISRLTDSGIYVVMLNARLVPPRVRAFSDFLAERFADPALGE